MPQTLIEVLKHFASDFVPETQAACDCINQWLANNPNVPSGTEVERHLGFCDFSVQGLEMNAAAQPFRFYLLKRVQDEYQSLGEAARAICVRIAAGLRHGNPIAVKNLPRYR